MADNTVKPGVPSAKSVDKAVDSVTSKESSSPSGAASVAQQVDRTILRLNKLLATPGGLSAFLSTFNYTLYTLAYLQSQSPTIASHARKLLSIVSSTSFQASTKTLVADGAVPPIAALAGLVSRARTTLRLFGLFPLYAWMRTLLAGPKPGADKVLHRIAVLQCASYAVYQALENICLLADNGIVSKSMISLINRGDSTTARLYLYAFRAWLGGVSCDFLRLGREWQIESARRSKRDSEGKAEDVWAREDEDKKFDKRWWTDCMIAGAWFPMAWHYSSSTGGIPGWNLGWMGLCGLVAGSSRARGLWRATA